MAKTKREPKPKAKPQGEAEPPGGEAQEPTPDTPRTSTHQHNAPPTRAGDANEGVNGGVSTFVPTADGEEADRLACKRRWAEAGNRWTREGRRQEADAFREIVRLECQARGMSRTVARVHSWDATIAAFPPKRTSAERGAYAHSAAAVPTPEFEPPHPDANGQISGLGSIPGDWPALPANASLQAEVGWVQSNRLVVVEERPTGGTAVHLDRAAEPAPSRAALGWLETSIRSYAKYVDVVARSLGTAQDEQDEVRRERVAIGEIDAILDEMGVNSAPAL